MNKWIIGARVKTLPAAISPVLVGTALATEINWLYALLALIVSLSLQIAVNFANDYSDGIRGTDSNRVGPIRLVGSGLAAAKSVKRAMFIGFSVAAIAGLILALQISYWLLLVGAISILAAWGYTGGKKPYGYFGFGEVSVFLFFGVVATVGSYYIQTQKISGQSVLLSIPVGALACAILVMNNLRDLPMDAQVGKRTFSVRIGDRNTRYFYVALLVLAQVISAYAYTFNSYALLTLIWLPLTVKNCRLVLQGVSGKELIPLLISTARLQLLLSFTLGIALFL
ncbi:MAG: 1,4-dihydroxy-2-naphthoate polyprenyltransferase [Actinomycetes bacterium]